MRAVTAAFPEDAERAHLRRVADGQRRGILDARRPAYDETREIQRALENVFAINRNHPARCTLDSLVEATDTPERAEAEADRLLPLMPGPATSSICRAHLSARRRHADVIASNLLAAKADEDTSRSAKRKGLPDCVLPTNCTSWMGATASGQGKLALDSARRVANSTRTRRSALSQSSRAFSSSPMGHGALRAWDDPRRCRPAARHRFTRGVWRYARAMALTRKDVSRCGEGAGTLKVLVSDPEIKGQVTFSNKRDTTSFDCAEVIAGEIAARRKDWDKATLHSSARSATRTR